MTTALMFNALGRHSCFHHNTATMSESASDVPEDPLLTAELFLDSWHLWLATSLLIFT